MKRFHVVDTYSQRPDEGAGRLYPGPGRLRPIQQLQRGGAFGATVINVANGAAGIKILQSGAKIEVLITDVGLPGGMNGRQVADAARALPSGLKVLFITGYAENAAVGNGHLEPGMKLLTKPFSMEALMAKVGTMMVAKGIGSRCQT